MPSVRGAIKRWKYRKEGSSFCVGEYVLLDGSIVSVVGDTIYDAPLNQTIDVLGDWETKPKHGKQLTAVSWMVPLPVSSSGIRNYLAAGNVKGIGPERADLLYKHFGNNLAQILEETPERVAEVKGIGPVGAKNFVESWKENLLHCQLAVALEPYAFTGRMIEKIAKALGPEAISIVRQNPYSLLRIHGVGFKTVDKAVEHLGWDPLDPRRLDELCIYLLSEASLDGHVFLTEAVLLQKAEKEYQTPAAPMRLAIERLLHANRLVEEIVPTQAGVVRLLYTYRLHEAETGVAEGIARILHSPFLFHGPQNLLGTIMQAESNLGFVLNAEQRAAIENVFTSPVSILTGAPGTGKTSSVKVLLEILRMLEISPVICAPTGRAAKHIQSVTKYDAVTIHKLLGYRGEGEWAFDRLNPLPSCILIVDELSMVDVDLFHRLIEALGRGSTLLLIGDKDQLPAVGPGRVLDDLIRSNRIPYTRLTHVFRQAATSQIIQNAHRILKGEPMVFPANNGQGSADCYQQKPPTYKHPETGKQTEDTDWIKDRIKILVKDRIPAKMKVDPIRQIQVLSPMIKYDCGVEDLNSTLQSVLNPDGQKVPFGSKGFRIGDRVMVTENNTELGLSNGDIGFIKSYEVSENGRSLLVEFYGEDVWVKDTIASDFKLAYAMSIHKSQGSESEVIILVLLKKHFIMLQRNLLFTAITRAKKMLVVFAMDWVLNKAIKNVTTSERNSYLAHRLKARLPLLQAAA